MESEPEPAESFAGVASYLRSKGKAAIVESEKPETLELNMKDVVRN